MAPKKRRKATIDGELEDSMAIDWLQNSPSASECERDHPGHDEPTYTPNPASRGIQLVWTSPIDGDRLPACQGESGSEPAGSLIGATQVKR